MSRNKQQEDKEGEEEKDQEECRGSDKLQ